MDELLKQVPELRGSFEKEMEWWGDEHPGAHIVVGDLLTPLLESEL